MSNIAARALEIMAPQWDRWDAYCEERAYDDLASENLDAPNGKENRLKRERSHIDRLYRENEMLHKLTAKFREAYAQAQREEQEAHRNTSPTV